MSDADLNNSILDDANMEFSPQALREERIEEQSNLANFEPENNDFMQQLQNLFRNRQENTNLLDALFQFQDGQQRP